MRFDLPLPELTEYRPEVAEPADFEAFWTAQLAGAREADLDLTAQPVDTPLAFVDSWDVTFRGYGGDPVKAWFLRPRELDPAAPVLVEFIGYGGGRGDLLEWMTWSCLGYPHLVMDIRGQGGSWRGADTPDPSDDGAPSTRGFMTRGIASPQTHYYTRLFVDAARAVDAAAGLPGMAGRPLLTTGGSQGGALTLAAAQLNDRVAGCLPDVPFLAHIRRATEITDAHPYAEVAEYCRLYPHRVEDVFATLSYLDVVNHARRTRVPALFSVGLVDDITPPSTVFAAYNHYAGPKQIEVYPYNGHEGGGVHQFRRKIAFVQQLTGR